jgi:hypothetical protein
MRTENSQNLVVWAFLEMTREKLVYQVTFGVSTYSMLGPNHKIPVSVGAISPPKTIQSC